VGHRKRNRTAHDHIRRAWDEGVRSAQDEGLRESYLQLPRLPVRLICSVLDKGINYGNLLRIADAYRIERVCFAKVEGRAEVFAGSVGAHEWQPFGWGDPGEAIAAAKQAGCTVYGLHLGPQSVDVHQVEWRFPLAVVIGEELWGLSEEHAARCDRLVAIPLFGIVQSLNVAVATAICLDRIAAQAARENERFRPARAVSRRLLQ
jgi:tRNA (guanosine-2'-O-)-methyltransferase